MLGADADGAAPGQALGGRHHVAGGDVLAVAVQAPGERGGFGCGHGWASEYGRGLIVFILRSQNGGGRTVCGCLSSEDGHHSCLTSRHSLASFYLGTCENQLEGLGVIQYIDGAFTVDALHRFGQPEGHSPFRHLRSQKYV